MLLVYKLSILYYNKTVKSIKYRLKYIKSHYIIRRNSITTKFFKKNLKKA